MAPAAAPHGLGCMRTWSTHSWCSFRACPAPAGVVPPHAPRLPDVCMATGIAIQWPHSQWAAELCKPFPLPGPAALGGMFTSPDRPTDRPAGGGPGRGAQVDGGLATSAAAPHWGPGVGRAVGIGPAPQPPRPIPAHPSLHHRRCGPSPSAGTAKGAVAASARTNVLAMQAECRSTNRPTRLPNQPAKHDRECSRPEGGSPPQSKVRRSVPRSGFMRITLRKAGAQGPPSYVRPECRPCHH